MRQAARRARSRAGDERRGPAHGGGGQRRRGDRPKCLGSGGAGARGGVPQPYRARLPRRTRHARVRADWPQGHAALDGDARGPVPRRGERRNAPARHHARHHRAPPCGAGVARERTALPAVHGEPAGECLDSRFAVPFHLCQSALREDVERYRPGRAPRAQPDRALSTRGGRVFSGERRESARAGHADPVRGQPAERALAEGEVSRAGRRGRHCGCRHRRRHHGSQPTRGRVGAERASLSLVHGQCAGNRLDQGCGPAL